MFASRALLVVIRGLRAHPVVLPVRQARLRVRTCQPLASDVTPAGFSLWLVRPHAWNVRLGRLRPRLERRRAWRALLGRTSRAQGLRPARPAPLGNIPQSRLHCAPTARRGDLTTTIVLQPRASAARMDSTHLPHPPHRGASTVHLGLQIWMGRTRRAAHAQVVHTLAPLPLLVPNAPLGETMKTAMPALRVWRVCQERTHLKRRPGQTVASAARLVSMTTTPIPRLHAMAHLRNAQQATSRIRALTGAFYVLLA